MVLNKSPSTKCKRKNKDKQALRVTLQSASGATKVTKQIHAHTLTTPAITAISRVTFKQLAERRNAHRNQNPM